MCLYLNTCFAICSRYNVLRKSSGLEDMGSLQWHLILSNFIAWLLVALALIKGVKSLGKVMPSLLVAAHTISKHSVKENIINDYLFSFVPTKSHLVSAILTIFECRKLFVIPCILHTMYMDTLFLQIA